MLPSLPFLRVFRRRPLTSPTRSTPSLEDPIHFHTPVEEALATPDLADNEWSYTELWPELTKPIDFEYHHPKGLLFQPAPIRPIIQEQSALRSERHHSPSPPPQTVAPQDVFCDYEEVRRVLAEQDRPTSPSTCSTSLSTPGQYDHLDLPDVEPSLPLSGFAIEASSGLGLSTRQIGTKAKRDELEDDIEEPEAKRRAVSSSSSPSPSRRSVSPLRPPHPISRRSACRQASRKTTRCAVYSNVDDDYVPPPPRLSVSLPVTQEDPEIETDDKMDIDDVDDDAENDGDFRPGYSKPRGTPAKMTPTGRKRGVRGKPGANRKVRSSNQTQSPPKASSQKPPQSKNHILGPCHCRTKGCSDCDLTCLYVFTYGPRKGEVCRHFFESGRWLDFNRHKDMHGVHEWFASKILRIITPEQASWFNEECRGKTTGFVCPNHKPGWDGTIGKGDCGATFTRRDALKRHLDRHTCFNTLVEELTKKGSIDMGRVVEQSEKLLRRLEPIIDSAFSKRKTGEPLTEEEEIVMKRLAKFEQEQE